MGVVRAKKWSGQNRTGRTACYAYECRGISVSASSKKELIIITRFRQNHRIQEVIAKGEASNIVDVDAKSILVLHCFIVKERFGKGAKQSQV